MDWNLTKHGERTQYIKFTICQSSWRISLARTYEAVYASILENRELQSSSSERSTRHIEISLPEGATYKEGDHLGVLPINSEKNVNRILKRFGLNGKDQVILSASGRSVNHIPLDSPVRLYDLLSYSVEVQEAATRAQIREMVTFTACPPHKRNWNHYWKTEFIKNKY